MHNVSRPEAFINRFHHHDPYRPGIWPSFAMRNRILEVGGPYQLIQPLCLLSTYNGFYQPTQLPSPKKVASLGLSEHSSFAQLASSSRSDPHLPRTLGPSSNPICTLYGSCFHELTWLSTPKCIGKSCSRQRQGIRAAYRTGKGTTMKGPISLSMGTKMCWWRERYEDEWH